mmetsp:Transcript_20404/g.81597  ORF Transcript_20404/g.81597 Transcript_20404/m.81597 type:complete len:203 (+) Transcript_20404:747-1355(+)
MRGSTTWLQMTFIVFSWRISTRSRSDSRCLRIFTSPTPRSIHSLDPEPLLSSVSVKRYSLARILNTISSSSSIVLTSTSSSCTTGVNSCVDSCRSGCSAASSSSVVAAAGADASPNFCTGCPAPKSDGSPAVDVLPPSAGAPKLGAAAAAAPKVNCGVAGAAFSSPASALPPNVAITPSLLLLGSQARLSPGLLLSECRDVQ